MKATDLTCQEAVEALGGFMTGSLEEEARTQIEQHLRGCSDCTTYLDQMEQTVQLTAQLAEPTAPTQETMSAATSLFRRWSQQRASGVRVVDPTALFQEWKKARGQ